jgi:hypothetical protein
MSRTASPPGFFIAVCIAPELPVPTQDPAELLASRLHVVLAASTAALHRGFIATFRALLALTAARAFTTAAILLAFLHGYLRVFPVAARLAVFHRALVFAATVGRVFRASRRVMATARTFSIRRSRVGRSHCVMAA